MNYQELQKISKLWSKLLIKSLKDYAKTHTQTWYGAKFNPKTTPLQIVYSKRKNAVYLWGAAPNKNVDKHHKVNKRIPWNKAPAGVSTNAKYVWHSEHFHRVFIPNSEVDVSRGFAGASRKAGTKGFWFTAKKKLENTGPSTFYTRHSHYSIKANSEGYTRIKGTAGRTYPFPAQWKFDAEGLHYDFHLDAVSDKIMRSTNLVGILDETLTEALNLTNAKFL